MGVFVNHLLVAITYLEVPELLIVFRVHFTMQKYNLQKNPLKETKILQDTITL
jgi:hypothetical protein